VANAYGKHIRGNAIALGMILTESAERNVRPAMLAYLEEHNALARLGRMQDVAEVVSFLFSDEASFITGEVIAVDGGFTSHLPALVD
jgi:NAD(P)-dependent dehydrogenase (short-subunit alcohol dehydrogenase family)